MKSDRFIVYYRVSTSKQGVSGLGMEAQKEAVTRFLEHSGGIVLDTFKEVDSGKSNTRQELAKAIRLCKVKNCKLLVSKLDRLSRDIHIITSLQKSDVAFVVAENPDCNNFTIHILAAVAEHEREMISQRTKAALAAAKARGVKLGNPRISEAGGGDTTKARAAKAQKANEYSENMKPTIEDIQNELENPSLRQIAAELNERGFKTPRGCEWTATGVSRVMARW